MRSDTAWGGRHPSGYTDLLYAGKFTLTQEIGSMLNSMVFSESLYSPTVAKWSGKSPSKDFTAYWVTSKLLARIQSVPQSSPSLPLQPQPPITLYATATVDELRSCLCRGFCCSFYAFSLSQPSESLLLFQWCKCHLSPLLPLHFSRLVSHTPELAHHILHPSSLYYVDLFVCIFPFQ